MRIYSALIFINSFIYSCIICLFIPQCVGEVADGADGWIPRARTDAIDKRDRDDVCTFRDRVHSTCRDRL